MGVERPLRRELSLAAFQEVDTLTDVGVRALGGGKDDWPALFGPGGVAVEAAAAGRRLVLRAGNPYICNSAQTLPSGLLLECEPGVRIVSSLPNGIFQVNAPFCALAATTQTTDLTANVVVGSRTFAVAETAAYPVGTRLAVGLGNRFGYYTVTARSASSGAGTLTVERPILWAFLSGDDVHVVASQPTGIRLFGHGAWISGTGDRAIEFAAGLDCIVDGFHIDAAGGFGGIVASFDVGSENCHFRDVHIVGGYDAQGGIALESADRCSIVDCSVVNVATTGSHVGVYVVDSVGCTVERVYSTRNVIGMSFEGSGEACRSCSAAKCTIVGNTNDGVRILNGSTGIALIGCTSSHNAQHGVSGANSASFTIDDCEISSNTGAGVTYTAGSVARVSATRCVDNATDNITAGGDLVAVNLDLRGGSLSSCIAITGSANAQITGCRFAPNTTNGVAANGILVSTTGLVQVSDCLIVLSGTGTKCAIQQNAAGELHLANVRSTGGSHGLFMLAGAAHLGCGVHLGSTTTPLSGAGIDGIAFGGVSAIAMTTANKTATWAEYSAGTLVISGTLGAGRDLVLPSIKVPWIAKNTADQTVTVKGASGTGVAVTAGSTARVIFDGTNFISA